MLHDDLVGLQAGGLIEFLCWKYGAIGDKYISVKFAGILEIGSIFDLKDVSPDIIGRRTYSV